VSNDLVAKQAHHIFSKYVESSPSADWLWRRVVESQAGRIIVLGGIAEHGLLRLFHRRGMAIQTSDAIAIWTPHQGVTNGLRSTLWPARYADASRQLGHWVSSRAWWTLRGSIEGNPRSWKILPVIHPAWAQPGAYVTAVDILHKMSSFDA